MKAETKTRTPRYEPLVKLPHHHYEALRRNIVVNGMPVPMLVDGDGSATP